MLTVVSLLKLSIPFVSSQSSNRVESLPALASRQSHLDKVRVCCSCPSMRKERYTETEPSPKTVDLYKKIPSPSTGASPNPHAADRLRGPACLGVELDGGDAGGLDDGVRVVDVPRREARGLADHQHAAARQLLELLGEACTPFVVQMLHHLHPTPPRRQCDAFRT